MVGNIAMRKSRYETDPRLRMKKDQQMMHRSEVSRVRKYVHAHILGKTGKTQRTAACRNANGVGNWVIGDISPSKIGHSSFT